MSEGTSEFICMAGLAADWKAAAGEANVNARGSEIGAAIRARAMQARYEAVREMTKYPPRTMFHYGQFCVRSAYDEVLAWLDDLEANAAT